MQSCRTALLLLCLTTAGLAARAESSTPCRYEKGLVWVDLYFVAAVTFFLSAQELDFSGDFDHAASPDAAEALRVGRYGSQAALFVA